MREIVFDTETTGIDVRQGHKIIEIGCVEMIDKKRTGEVYHAYVNPMRDVPQSSTEIHGLTEEFLKDKPLFKDVAQDFLDFVKDDKLVIHNAAFDMRFINYELDSAGFKEISYERAIDTLIMARKKFPGGKNSLDALCQKFSISLEKRTKHGALLDSELLADVYIELVGGAQSSLLLKGDNKGEEQSLKNHQKVRRKKTITIQPTEDELARHQECLGEIKEPLWNESS